MARHLQDAPEECRYSCEGQQYSGRPEPLPPRTRPSWLDGDQNRKREAGHEKARNDRRLLAKDGAGQEQADNQHLPAS